MRDLFICPRNSLRTNWSDACPSAKVYKAVSSVRLSRKDAYLFWLHVDADSQNWAEHSIQQVIKNFPQSRIIILSNVPDQAEALIMLGWGALGYCHAFSAAELLLEVKNAVLHGGIWIGRDLLKSMISATTALVGNKTAVVESNLGRLTKREKQVAIEASKGLSNKEIARALKITERTVKAHLSATFERLGVKDRLQLALMLNEKNSS